MTQPAMNRDFVEMLRALIDAGVEFLVVGAHAMAVHGVPRATGDFDIWVRPSQNKRASGRSKDLVDLEILEADRGKSQND